MRDQDLSIAMLARTDSNRWDADCICDLLRDIGNDNLEHHGKCSGVFNCTTGGPLPWVPGGSGSMFGVGGRYLQRNTDYRSVLGEIIRKHLGATQAQLSRIIPGYGVAGENLLGGGTSSIDGIQIRGEVGIL